MSDHLPVLKVRLFGGFSASYGEIPVSFGRNTTTKAMKLLQILLYHGDTGISRDKLLDELYGREELADAANNLRVTAHRLKKIIVDAGLPSHDYINIKKGIYRWDAPMPTEVDAHQFKVLSKDVQTCTDKVKKLALLKKICLMYRGEFLPELSGDEWVLVESVQYKNIYSESLQELCKLLIERGDYEEALRFCDQDVLAEFLKKYRAEVTNMILTTYDKDLYEKTLKEDAREEGREEIRAELNEFKLLNKYLLKSKRYNDLERATEDIEYQKKLLKEFGIE